MSTSAERMRRLRERKAGSAEAGPGAPLRDAGELLGPAVEETIAALDLAERDAGAVQLARRYAAIIDRAKDPAYALRWIGPLLLDVLEQLQATPSTRAQVKPGPSGPSRLELLRQARPRTDPA